MLITKKASIVFAISFCVAVALHGIWLHEFDVIDAELWATQAQQIHLGDENRYDRVYEYTPMAVIMAGTIAIHSLGFSYHSALITFLSAFDALVIALIVTLCHVRRPDGYWFLIVLGILSFNRLYIHATPSSLSSSLLFILLFLISLRIHANEGQASLRDILVLAFVTGLMCSIRLDVGVLGALSTVSLLFRHVSWKAIGIYSIATIAFLVLLDPFMWQGPIQHVINIFTQTTGLHGQPNTHLFLSASTLSVSVLAFISMLLMVLDSRITPKQGRVLSGRPLIILIAISVILYGIFLSSSYQPPRYILPVVLFWEMLLPLYLIGLLSKVQLQGMLAEHRMFDKGKEFFVMGLLFSYQLAVFYVIY